MTLRDRLERLIAAEGPLTVDRWMTLCLHDPGGGYYATRPALGAEGDFLTAPLVSQMFGELLGLWSVAAWIALGRPARVRWVELGPGDGTLIADARRAAARALPAFAAAVEITLVETSAPLRERQRSALGRAPPRWVDRLAEVGGEGPLIVLANEFLDCLPARQFVRTRDGWTERRVGLAEAGGFRFGLAPPPADFAPPAWAAGAPEGAVLELSLAQAALGAELGARVSRAGGAALLIDYGRAEPGLGDTLQALHRHTRVDPLATPGEADLTVHADFPAVAAAARAAGAQVSPVVTQSEFLPRLGIAARAEALARARPDQAEVIGRQLHRLLAPGEMGELFKVLAISAPGLVVPGFESSSSSLSQSDREVAAKPTEGPRASAEGASTVASARLRRPAPSPASPVLPHAARRGDEQGLARGDSRPELQGAEHQERRDDHLEPAGQEQHDVQP